MSLLQRHADYTSFYQVSADWQKWRQQALLDFQKSGLPNRQNEDWRYFSVRDLDKTDYVPALQTSQTGAALPTDQMPVGFYNLIFVDGFLQSPTWQDESIEIQPLLQSEIIFERFQSEKEKIKVTASDAFEKLNLAYARQGLAIKIKAGQKPAKALNLVFHSTQIQSACYPRVYIVLEPGAKLVLCENYFSSQEQTYFNNSVLEILLENTAELEYCRVQQEGLKAIHIGRTNIFLKKFSALQALSFSVGAQAARHNLDVFLTEPACHAQVNGVYLADGSQVVDNHTNVDFVVGDCHATQLYKGILSGSSRGVFNGRVHIRHGSQKASSQQLNKNLLLSQQAEADSKPQLEIYADDVQATHGSTVGQLSEEEIFYCLSRGISRQQAVQMLSLGFAQDMLDRVKDKKVQSWLETLLHQAYGRMKVL